MTKKRTIGWHNFLAEEAHGSGSRRRKSEESRIANSLGVTKSGRWALAEDQEEDLGGKAQSNGRFPVRVP